MSFMRSTGRGAGFIYGRRCVMVQIVAVGLCSVAFAAATVVPRAQAQAPAPVKIVALGDSLTAGYGLPDADGFVPRLQAALAAKGVSATLGNAGVSGDTAAD